MVDFKSLCLAAKAYNSSNDTWAIIPKNIYGTAQLKNVNKHKY